MRQGERKLAGIYGTPDSFFRHCARKREEGTALSPFNLE
jgi:hypothetical protein